jgi:Tol biopolymer transport system component/imidazolonepropionase-like amidohydrolase
MNQITRILFSALLAAAFSTVWADHHETEASPEKAAEKKEEKNDEKEKWDLDGEHGGQVSEIKFSTDEGTWLNVDVSPDGEWIVFDMLGDLYTLPIAGGQATRITSGRAMDVQPVFSPDGQQIAFTSDRAGGDNIWIVNADGSEPVQVTKEKFRLLNNPAWTPDGEYIVARKHFTSGRSLGAGEMWMYHRSGGGGVQLTKRKNDQQDAGEPVVSPDGRHVYFSEDMSGGSTFQYNKDANGSIYHLRRLDLESGDLISLVTGNGGAATPAPSPDGNKVAFVRRERDKSSLYLLDLASGGETRLFDGLSHDQQEAWAIFGVYPGFDWTPDNQSIVFWAKGKLHRIDVDSGEVTGIPFTADVEQSVVSAVRGEYPAWEESFNPQMLRDAITSPDGKTLVFNAVGHLWKVALPDGTPERVTKSDDFEYQPSFSPDGRRIVYVGWNDDELGSVRSVGLNGRGDRSLTEEPGYYAAPRFSPDGSKVVFSKGGGTSLLGYRYGLKRGIFWVDADGGSMTQISKSGRNPAFDASGEQVYYLTGGGLEKVFKRSSLDGSKVHDLFKLKYVNNVVVSPDGRWVAFNELYNAFVAPLPRVNTTIELNKDSKAIPIKQVTRDAGSYLHWSGGAERVHWLVGNRYFSAELKDAFDFVPGAPDELPDLKEAEGIAIEMQVESDHHDATIALSGARLITMQGEQVIEDGVVLVKGNRIANVGTRAAVSIPADAQVIDVSGKTIVPGFIDVHAHVNHFQSGPSTRANWPYYANLAYGVTTAHDPSATTAFVFSQSELVKAGKLVGPRIFSTGTILYGADGDFKALVNSLDDARSHLRRMQAQGAFSVKSYNQPRRDQRQQVNQAARELGMIVVMEGGSTFYHNLSMILDGSTGIEHNLPIAPLYQDVIGLWKGTDVRYTPTLVVSYGGVSGEYYWYQNTSVFDAKPLTSFVPNSNLDARARRRQLTPIEEYNHIEVSKAAKVALDAGVPVQVGGHGQMQGLAVHWEMWSLAQGGMSEMEVLRAATLAGADYIGMENDLGSIEIGKLADLVILDGNPLDDIRHTETTRHVMANGRLFATDSMDEVAPRQQARPAFWFERDDAQSAPASGPGMSYEHASTCHCGRH